MKIFIKFFLLILILGGCACTQTNTQVHLGGSEIGNPPGKALAKGKIPFQIISDGVFNCLFNRVKGRKPDENKC